MEKKPKGRELVAELVPDRFGTSLHFNRFGVERLDVATAVHFGLFNSDDELLATYSCVLFNEYLDRCEEDWLDYLGKIGTPKRHWKRVGDPLPLASQGLNRSRLGFWHEMATKQKLDVTRIRSEMCSLLAGQTILRRYEHTQRRCLSPRLKRKNC